MSDNPLDGTQHVPDGPAPATETQFVPDGTLIAQPQGSGVRPVPPGPPPSPWARPVPRRPSGDTTQHVSDLPRFGRFRALAELGAGAMGTVYRAQDEVLGRAVAIKALHARDAGTRERFLREARAIGAVLHPNILAVYDAGPNMEAPGFIPGAGVDEAPYLVMELAAGGSLRDRIQAGPLPIDTVREIGIQIARALAAAHAANIVHRDVKPANILAANGVWKLADFGIARLPDSTLTVEGQFLGSPSYAAPESLRAAQFSPASDIYGLGATLYEALTGVPPHGDHDMQSVVRKLEQDAPPLHVRRPVPAPLEHAVMATLARDPAQRPSADELARLLAHTSDAVLVPPPHASSSPRASTTRTAPSSRTKAIAIALAVVAIVLVIVALRHRGGVDPASLPGLAPNQRFAKPPTADKRDSRADKPRRGDEPDSRAAAPSPPAEPRAPAEPRPPALDPWASPQVLDENGNPVDDETARRILERMQRDAESEMNDFGHRRGRRWNR